MVLHNQIDLPTAVPDQAPQKVDEHLSIEVFLEHLEPEDPLVGQGRDDVAAEALPSAPDHGCPPLPTPSTPRLMVRAYPQLVTLRVLLVGPPRWFLKGQSPAPKAYDLPTPSPCAVARFCWPATRGTLLSRSVPNSIAATSASPKPSMPSIKKGWPASRPSPMPPIPTSRLLMRRD
jgi:hypothetical protein